MHPDLACRYVIRRMCRVSSVHGTIRGVFRQVAWDILVLLLVLQAIIFNATHDIF